MNLCTRTYQQEVAGIFVVDSPYSDEVAEIKNSKLSLLLKDMDQLPNTIDKIFSSYTHSEYKTIESTVNKIKKYEIFPKIPIAVIARQKKMPFMSAFAFNIHPVYQRKILKLLSSSSHVKCYKSGNFSQASEYNEATSLVSEIWVKLNTVSKTS